MYPSTVSYSLIYASLLILLPGRQFPTKLGRYMPIRLSGRPGPTRPKAVAGPPGRVRTAAGHEQNTFCLVLTLRTSPHSTSEDSKFVVGSLPLVGDVNLQATADQFAAVRTIAVVGKGQARQCNYSWQDSRSRRDFRSELDCTALPLIASTCSNLG